nr:MAG TPA: hypothetical protein [Caudoviricetes sp.]
MVIIRYTIITKVGFCDIILSRGLQILPKLA